MKRISQEAFKDLLNSFESKIIDFKSQHYNFSFEDDKVSFLKDIISFVNTIRDESAYIILGANEKNSDHPGITYSVDSSIFQNLLNDLVTPVPDITYQEINCEGVNFGVIEIPVRKYPAPITSNKSHGDKLLAEMVYIRKGSTNYRVKSLAKYSEIQEVREWITKKYDVKVSVFPGGFLFTKFENKFIPAVDSSLASMVLRRGYDYSHPINFIIENRGATLKHCKLRIYFPNNDLHIDLRGAETEKDRDTLLFDSRTLEITFNKDVFVAKDVYHSDLLDIQLIKDVRKGPLLIGWQLISEDFDQEGIVPFLLESQTKEINTEHEFRRYAQAPSKLINER